MIAHANELDQHNDHSVIALFYIPRSMLLPLSAIPTAKQPFYPIRFAGNPGYILSHVETFILFSWGQLQEKNYYYAGHVSYHLSPSLKSCRYKELCLLMMHMIKR